MLVELLSSGSNAKELSEEYGVEANVIRRWKRELSEKSGSFSNKREPTSEELELKRLRKELKDITMERDILKKAVGIFSKSDR